MRRGEVLETVADFLKNSPDIRVVEEQEYDPEGTSRVFRVCLVLEEEVIASDTITIPDP